jgi:hypothetical protein
MTARGITPARAREAYDDPRRLGRALPSVLTVVRVLMPAVLASTALVTIYLGIVALAQDWSHAQAQLREDLWFIAPIAVGFGAQIAMLLYLRGLHRRAGAAPAVTAGSTGTSSAAMLACCAHHVSDLVPIVGASGAAIFLNDIKTPLALASIAMNGAGVLYLASRLWRFNRSTAALARNAHHP